MVSKVIIVSLTGRARSDLHRTRANNDKSFRQNTKIAADSGLLIVVWSLHNLKL
ncbi:hypothetical protein [Chroococcidiopsis sp. CCNUC1]|uniref:hypothetical protein n=1 Tax=Chroococcidiopsis sp. CCNUC1 TaxID=2653189 RepID=UPI002021EC50|nr:hypothetical protein [Chroococcidiopsis sp. CCNUC1]URD48641.1 hypothetical protein M5J74_20175 [Chroococcidiopsis sp. CCNUC1]